MERGLVAPSLQVRHSRTGGASRRRDRCESWPFVDSAQAAGRPVLDHWCQDFYTTKWCANAVTESAWDFVRDSGPDAQAIGSCDGFACAAGCACEPGPPDAGARGVCDCGGLDGGTDASSDAAGDAPSDSDSGGGAAVEPCGVITCRGGCICTSPTDSACVCL
jgi:hypothetical protein